MQSTFIHNKRSKQKKKSSKNPLEKDILLITRKNHGHRDFTWLKAKQTTQRPKFQRKQNTCNFSTTKLKPAISTQCPPKNRGFTAPSLTSRKIIKKGILLHYFQKWEFYTLFLQNSALRNPFFKEHVYFSYKLQTMNSRCGSFSKHLQFSTVSHEKLHPRQVAVLKNLLTVSISLILRKKNKNQCVCPRQLHRTHSSPCKFGFNSSIVFQAEKMMLLQHSLQITQLLVQAFWGWGIFLGLDSPLTYTKDQPNQINIPWHLLLLQQCENQPPLCSDVNSAPAAQLGQWAEVGARFSNEKHTTSMGQS